MVITRPPRLPQPPRGVGVAIEARSGVRWADLLGAPAPTRAECEALDELVQTRCVSPGQAVFTHETRAQPGHADLRRRRDGPGHRGRISAYRALGAARPGSTRVRPGFSGMCSTRLR
jgi:hypothetical protein